MKNMLALLLLMLCPVAYAETVIRQLMPDGQTIDYRAPAIVVDKDKAYPTRPGSNDRDYTKPGYIIEGDKVYPMYPGTTDRDYRKPALKIGK